MIRQIRNLNALPLLLAVVMCACSPGAESPNPPDTNTSQPAPSASSPPAAQPTAPATPIAAPQPAPSPELPKPEAPANAPKLFVQTTKIDFGTQPKDKTITRSIVLKNVGKSELNIESVVPS